MTTTTTEDASITDLPADDQVEFTGSYTSKNTSEPAAQNLAEEEEPKAKPARPYFTGWCGPGPECRDDTREFNKAGEPIRRCVYACENGSKAIRPITYCACSCHRDPERAGQAVERA